jgi:hypothetical protein
MINLKDSINNINFNDSKSGYQVEYDEHYEDVLKIVKDEETAKEIVKAIVEGHLRENADYYEYLEAMEREMNE